jgi:hypothetical protein
VGVPGPVGRQWPGRRLGLARGLPGGFDGELDAAPTGKAAALGLYSAAAALADEAPRHGPALVRELEARAKALPARVRSDLGRLRARLGS